MSGRSIYLIVCTVVYAFVMYAADTLGGVPQAARGDAITAFFAFGAGAIIAVSVSRMEAK